MNEVTPYLLFQGNCEEAFLHYKSALGGEFSYMQRFQDIPEERRKEMRVAESEETWVIHVSLSVRGNVVLMGCDILRALGETVTVGSNVAVSIQTENEEETKLLFDGLATGGTVTMPLQNTFWNAYYGTCIDKFGIHWMVNYDRAATSS